MNWLRELKRLKISEGVKNESFDREKANAAFQRLEAAPGHLIKLTHEEQKLWLEVMQAVRTKLADWVNANDNMKADWPLVNGYIQKSESEVMMFNWSGAWFDGPTLIRLNPNITHARIVYDPYDKLDVPKNMYYFLRYRFMGKWIERKIKNNSLKKGDIPLIEKLASILK